ncbi:MAG: hypothetical protein II758_03545 [Prevotella sp.]|nr:hypothetical protein [Prevotella sp.]
MKNYIYLIAVALLMVGCSSENEPSTLNPQPSALNYINLAISVNGGINSSSRAVPAGGEDGDGREAGFTRENNISGITLILYQGTGVNAAASTAIDFVAYYPVSRVAKDADSRIEATYETGNCLVPHNTIDFTKTYHAIVVANANLTSSLAAGSSTLGDVRDMTVAQIYRGDETKSAQQCEAFVMASEQDNTLNFSASGVMSRDAAGDYIYNLTSQPLVIERLAARIDFWAVGATYSDGTTYGNHPGYVYNVTGSLTDKFVVTGVMPFNLTYNNATYGNEYLLKRLTESFSTVTPVWLATETTTNHVLDPLTTSKLTATTPALVNALGDVKDLPSFAANGYFKSVTAMHAALGAGTTAGYSSLTDAAMTGEDVIVAYPMENTLIPGESLLYYHATGVAVEGYYYTGGLSGTAQRYVYYGYLRHQGEGASYDILTTNSTTEMSSSTAMNFAVVRNNIYRVWINGVDEKGSIELAIKVKKWDPFTHSVIYM